MKKSISIGTAVAAFILLLASSLIAGAGGLNDKVIESCKEALDLSGQNRAIYNALTNADIAELALNHELLQYHNDIFNHKVTVKGITNQKSSGRCWLFSSLNIFRPAVIEKYKLKEFEFSQNYLAFWDKMEKANTFLEFIIEFRDRDLLDRELIRVLKMPFGDGGYWHYTSALIDKYGLVPKEVMPETNSSGKTAMMNKLIGRKLRADAVKLRRLNEAGKTVKELRSAKEKMLTEVYKMLVMNLGEPPEKFSYVFEDRDTVVNEPMEFTPKSFYEKFTDIDLSEFRDVYNDPSREYGKHYTISLTKEMYDHSDIQYVNAPIEVLKEAALKAVLDNEPVLFACDVGKDQSRDLGIMADGLFDFESLYGVEMEMTKAERSLFRESTVNHAMVLVGVDVREGKPVKWKVENSWGDKKGQKGYWTMYDDWFDKHVYDIVIKEKYLPEDVLAVYDEEPIVLPPWDPMWQVVMSMSY